MAVAGEGRPAERAGIQPTYRDTRGRVVLGDLIVAVDGREIASGLDPERVDDYWVPGSFELPLTVRSLADESFNVVVVEDCCAAGTDELHRKELEIINMIYCHVMSSAELRAIMALS